MPVLMKLPSFKTVVTALTTLSSPASAAESHGILCALLCGGVRIGKQAWVDSLLASFVDHQKPTIKAATQVLTDLFVATEGIFKSDSAELMLQPLLPAKTEPLHLRIQALTEWCQGFLSSLKILGLSVGKSNPIDIEEVLNDLTKIACLNYDAEDVADAEGEASYLELVNYMGEAALLIYGSRETLFPRAANKK